MKIALLVFFFGLTLTSIGIVKLPIILGVVVIIYCLLKIIPIRQVYKSVEWPVIVLLASIIPLGAALETNGTTSLIVDALTNFCIGLEPWLIISLLMILTMTLSDMLNNTDRTHWNKTSRKLTHESRYFPYGNCHSCIMRFFNAYRT